MSANQQALFMAAGGAENDFWYTVPGTYCWVAPSGVCSVSAVAVGGGGGGNGYEQSPDSGGCAAGGGALAYVNNIFVTPGNSYQVNVGFGGFGGTAGFSPDGTNGGESSFKNGVTFLLRAGLGENGAGRAGGVVFVGTGGGNGGTGGFSPSYPGGGGGGAGGYAGKGGNGGSSTGGSAGIGGATCSGAASGGNSGGCVTISSSKWSTAGGSGGGVGIVGKGATGGITYRGAYGCSPGADGGSCGTRSASHGGSPSAVDNLRNNGYNCTPIMPAGNYGIFGGGGAGGGRYSTNGGISWSYYDGADGGSGAVRIVAPGCARSFPSTNVGYPLP